MGEGTYEWEVSRAKGLAARIPVLRGATDPAIIAEAIASVLNGGHAVLVIRSDWTPEARKARWESEFYDVDRAGRRRRRYRKTNIERQWEQFFTAKRRADRSNRSVGRTGNMECPECGDKWSRRTPADYIHVCPGGGVVRKHEGDG